MNFQLANFTPTSTLTMNSREIAVLAGKVHSHVMRDIRTMMADLEQNPNLDSVCKSSNRTSVNNLKQPRRAKDYSKDSTGFFFWLLYSNLRHRISTIHSLN